MKYIVLSGYDDFIYVKQALQRQVLDYLLKPLSAQGIMKVLRRAKEQLDEQDRQRVNLEILRDKVAKNAQQLRRGVVLEYLSGSFGGDAHALCAYPQPVDERIAFPMYLAVLSLERTEENLEVLRRDFDSQPMLLGASVEEVLSEVFKRRQGEFIQYRSQFLLLLPASQEEAIAACDDAIQSLRHYLHLTATGRPLGRDRQLFRAQRGVSERHGRPGQAPHRRPGPGLHPELQPREPAQGPGAGRLAHAGGRAVPQRKEGGDRRLLRGAGPARGQRPDGRQRAPAPAPAGALGGPCGGGRSGVDVAPAFPGLHMEWVLQPADITAGVEQLGTLMQFVSDAVRREVATSGSELIAQAVAYTQSNYADKDLSLESLCALFQISQTQFSLLFKREMGTSFLQYLLDQRIAAAQKLLRETSMKIYQIAEETGFGDASYFSYCFKQRCGLSPKEYRMQGGA